MENNRFNSDSHAQFVLSYELLCLLYWLVGHDEEKLKKLIKKALQAGLQEKLQKIDHTHDQNMQEIQHSIVDFFSLLESLLHECMAEQVERKARERNLMTSIDHIDTAFCDEEIVRSSLEKATSQIELNPEENPKDLLFKELLKQWKPHNKVNIN